MFSASWTGFYSVHKAESNPSELVKGLQGKGPEGFSELVLDTRDKAKEV
jgi:hypothetical protein